PGDAVDQSALARSGRSADHHHLAPCDRGRALVQHLGRPVPLADAVDDDQRAYLRSRRPTARAAEREITRKTASKSRYISTSRLSRLPMTSAAVRKSRTPMT